MIDEFKIETETRQHWTLHLPGVQARMVTVPTNYLQTIDPEASNGHNHHDTIYLFSIRSRNISKSNIFTSHSLSSQKVSFPNLVPLQIRTTFLLQDSLLLFSVPYSSILTSTVMSLRGWSKDRSGRKVTPPGPTYMSNDQFGTLPAFLCEFKTDHS